VRRSSTARIVANAALCGDPSSGRQARRVCVQFEIERSCAPKQHVEDEKMKRDRDKIRSHILNVRASRVASDRVWATPL